MKRYFYYLMILIGFSFSAYTSPLMAQNKVMAQNKENMMLTTQQQAIVPIAAFTANGNIEQLKQALNDGLDQGLTINEIKEVLVQTYAYAGFPRSLNGLNAFMDVLEARKEAGKQDQIGKDISPIPTDRPMLEIGTDIQTDVVGQPVQGGVYAFAPAIDQFLKSHLFGDIFARDILDYQTREVATIAMLASISGLDNQLQGHMAIGMNTGLSESQVQQIISILGSKVDKTIGDNAQTVLDRVLKK